MRGGDVACNPVALAYAYIDHDTATLFVDEAKVPKDVAEALQAASVDVRDYDRAPFFEGRGGGSHGLRRPIEVLRGSGGCDPRAQPY